MAINFPSGPSVNQIFSDPTSGFTYQWNGTVWVNYNYTAPAKIQELDDISGSFNSSTQTFALTVSSSAVSPVKADQLIINIGGVAQNPGIDYTVSGSNITFTTAPDAGLDFYGVLLGGSTNLTEAATGTVRPDSLSSGAPSWNTSGDLKVTGVTTIANTGTASTALTVLGGARITGILTVGSSSITIDGTNNEIAVGTGVTLSSSGITVGIITGTFYGDGSGLDNVGVGTTGSINTSGIITASSFHGDGSGLINLGGPLEPLTYSPGIGATGVSVNSNIVLTFGKPIKANTGTITLRTDSDTGTIIESYDVTSSSNLTINGGELTINPTDDFVGLTTYFVVFPAAAYKDTFESSSSVGITTYSFTSQQLNFELFAWGSSVYGENAQDDTTSYSSPRQIPGVDWHKTYVGSQHKIATKTDGTLWMWGRNQYGELGQNNTATNCSSPVQIPGTQWNYVSAGTQTTAATKTDGTLWMWGINNEGGLGQGDTTPYSSPVQVPGTEWEYPSTGTGNETLATKSDGTLWAWGAGGYGTTGQGDTTQYSSPRQIPGTQWNTLEGKINVGYNSATALKTDGTLWGWGRNGRGQLGQNDVIHRSSPIQVPGTQWASTVRGSRAYNGGYIKTDGTLWSCGYNGSGRLGHNNTTEYSSPTQVPGTQWSSICFGYNSAFSIKNDNTMWVWGANDVDGRLGQNNTTSYSSPIQVPGSQWQSVFAYQGSNAGPLAIKQTS